MIVPLSSPVSDTHIDVTSVYGIISDMEAGFISGGWTIPTHYFAHARLTCMLGPPWIGATFKVGSIYFQFFNALYPTILPTGYRLVPWNYIDYASGGWYNMDELGKAMSPFFGGAFTEGYDSLGRLYIEFFDTTPAVYVASYLSWQNQCLWDCTWSYGHGFIAQSQTYKGNTIQLKVLGLDDTWKYSIQVLSPVVTSVVNCQPVMIGIPPATYYYLVVNKYQAVFYPEDPTRPGFPNYGRFYPFILSLPWTPKATDDNYFLLLCEMSYAFTQRLTMDTPSNQSYGITYWAKTWNGVKTYGPADPNITPKQAAKFLLPGWGGALDASGYYRTRNVIKDSDNKALISEALIAIDSPSLVVGQLWDAFVTNKVTSLGDTETYLGHTYRVIGIDVGSYNETRGQLYLRVT